jgi:hypothetical protein
MHYTLYILKNSKTTRPENFNLMVNIDVLAYKMKHKRWNETIERRFADANELHGFRFSTV